MSLSFVNSAVGSAANSTQGIGNKPTGTTTNDFMVAHIYINGSVMPNVVPTGWSLLDSITVSSVINAIYIKIAGSSEPSTYEWDWAAAVVKQVAITSVRSSVVSTITVDSFDKQSNASSVTTSFKAITTIHANTFLLFLARMGANTSRAPDGGEDERYDTGLVVHQYGMTTPFVGPGSTGIHTCTGAAASTSVGYTIALYENIPITGPNAPSGLTATNVGRTRIDLAWTDNSSDEANFELERSPNGSTGWTLIASPAANATSYSDTGLSPSTTYYYRIRAVNGAGNSAYTSTASDTTDPGELHVTELGALVEIGGSGAEVTQLGALIELAAIDVRVTYLGVLIEIDPEAQNYYAIHTGYNSPAFTLERIVPAPQSAGIKVTRRTHGHSGNLIDEFLYLELEFNVLSIIVYQALLVQLGLDSSDYNFVTITHKDKARKWKRWNGRIAIPEFDDGIDYENYFPKSIKFIVSELELSL